MIIVNNLTKSILDKTLFKEVSFIVHPREKVGLIGPNGAGKSTLLKIILGLETADRGTVDAQGERLGYLSQSPEFDLNQTVADILSLDLKPEAKKFLQNVGLANINVSLPYGNLSGGQKTRVALARLLQDHPTALLMDEPTNHLDLDALRWFEQWLKNFPGSVLLVSHDRRLLENAVDKIFEIDPDNHTFVEYSGGYREYVEQKEKNRQLQEAAFQRWDRERKRIEEWIKEKRAQKSPLVRARESYLQREIYGKPVVNPSNAKTLRRLDLDTQSPAGKRMVMFRDDEVVVGQRRLLSGVSFEVFGKDRVLLSGENGSGKTTILRLALGEIQPMSGTVQLGESVVVGYFSQEQEGLDLNKTVLDEFTFTKGIKISGDPRNVLAAFLFPGNSVFKKVGDLSMGERVRLAFAKLTHQNNTFLILDEPTNHLDIPSREVVESALREYEGAFIVVSHDRYFVDAIGITRELRIENRSVVEKLFGV